MALTSRRLRSERSICAHPGVPVENFPFSEFLVEPAFGRSGRLLSAAARLKLCHQMTRPSSLRGLAVHFGTFSSLFFCLFVFDLILWAHKELVAPACFWSSDLSGGCCPLILSPDAILSRFREKQRKTNWTLFLASPSGHLNTLKPNVCLNNLLFSC